MHVMVTGARGFIGKAVLERLERDSTKVTGTVRSLSQIPQSAREYLAVGDVGDKTDWTQALQGVDVVIHLAARAHVLNETSTDPMTEFKKINVDGAVTLAHQAAAAGVKRLVFISSIGVNGNATTDQPFTDTSTPAPHAAYAQSKFEAEEALKLIVHATDMELVIIRPPLVYAAHAPGNFRRLLKLVASGVPMPFAMINNLRSMISLENLADFIVCCAHHPAAAQQTFLVSDGEDLSLQDMIQLLASGMNKKTLQLPVPPRLMEWGASLIGKTNLYTQLCCSLQVDASKCNELLAWRPPISARAALREAGRQYGASRT